MTTQTPTGPEAADLAVRLAEIERLVRYGPHEALDRSRELLATDALSPDDVAYQRLLLAKASAQARIGETADGGRLMREVKAWAEERGESELLAMAHRRLSTLFRRIGDPALMLEHAVAAVELLDADSAVELRGDHLLGLADALGASGEFDSSLRRYAEAAELANAGDDQYLRNAVLNNLAYTQYEAGLADEAVATAERLLQQLAAAGQPLMSHNADTVARAYMAVGRYDDAAAAVEPLCAVPERGEDCDGLVMALLTLAEAKRLALDLRAATAALDRAVGLIDQYALDGVRAEAMRERAELLAAEGEYQAAYAEFKAFHDADVQLRALERDGRARTLAAVFEATEAQRSRDFFRELSVRDPLTGLHNRRHLDAILTELLDPVGGADVVTVALVDLDHFKRVNDTFSHAVGDTVLQKVAGLLADVALLDDGGVAARLGGEEFVLVLPGVSGLSAARRADALRRTIGTHPWHRVAAGLSVTTSIGVASFPADGSTTHELLAVADHNLYRAKRAGRDRVVSGG